MKTLKVGIASYDRMKARTVAIARGEHTPARGEPMVWFPSIESFAKVLSQRNRELLAMIARGKPDFLLDYATDWSSGLGGDLQRRRLARAIGSEAEGS